MSKKELDKLTYTMILHDARRKLGLTANEYIVADSIHRLSSKSSNPIPGWCWASRETLGEAASLSRKSTHDLIDRLIKKEVVERHTETSYLRTTDLWFNTVVVARSEINEKRVEKENKIAVATRRQIQALSSKRGV